MTEVTLLLRQAAQGDRQAFNRVIGLVHEELKAVAEKHMKHERSSHTLQPTALVNEVYLSLVGPDPVDFKDKNHFFAVASKKMREILVNYAKQRNAQKRGGGVERVALDLCPVAGEESAWDRLDILALDEAMRSLGARQDARSKRMARIVEMRFFGGMSSREIADSLNLAPRSIERELKVALMFLLAEMSGKAPREAEGK